MSLFRIFKLALTSLVCCWVLCGCNGEQELALTKQEFINPNASRQILILTKASEYRGKLIERLVKRMQKSYSFTVDDISKACDYNFIMYQKVFFMENTQGNSAPYLDSYFKDYTGVNNIVLVAITTDTGFSSTLPVPTVATSPNIETIPNTAEVLIGLIRQ